MAAIKYSMLLFLSLSLGACSAWKKDASAEEPINQDVKIIKKNKDNGDCFAMKEKPNNFNTVEYNHANIAAAQIVGRDLNLSYEFSGCSKGKAVLVLERTDVGKKATTVHLSLKVKGAGLCEMIIEDGACFDLNTLSVPSKEWVLVINENTEVIYQPSTVPY
jgi:hypothetical protein